MPTTTQTITRGAWVDLGPAPFRLFVREARDAAVLVFSDTAPTDINALGVNVYGLYWQGFPVNGKASHVWARALISQVTADVVTVGSGSGVTAPVVGADRATVTGTGVKGSSTVTVFKNGVQAGTTNASTAGAWTYTFSTALQTNDIVTYDGTVTSPATTVAPVTPVAPVNTVAPAITGTAQVGQTLTASTGTWSNSPTSYAYAFSVGGSLTQYGASSTYAPQTADVGKTVTVTVTASNAGGSAMATSAATSAVVAGVIPSAGLTMAQLPAMRVYQRSSKTGGAASKGAGSIPVAITLTATASSIEYRLRDALTSGNPTVQDWTTAGTNVAANATSVTCSGVPADAKQYFLDLRANSDNAQIVLGTSAVMMGRIIGFSGQSQMARQLVPGSGETIAGLGVIVSPYCSVYGVALADGSTNDGAGLPAKWATSTDAAYGSTFHAEFLRRQVAFTGVACAWVGYCQGSTQISRWAPGTADNVALRQVLDMAGGFEAFYWHQGGDDAGAGTTKAAYKSALDAMFADITQHNAIWGTNYTRLLTAMATRLTGGAGTIAQVTAIRQAHKEWAAANSGVYLEPHDINLVDNVHQGQPGAIILAQHAHRALALGDSGPTLGTPSRASGSAVITIPVTLPTGATTLVLTGNAYTRFSVYPSGALTGALTPTALAYDSTAKVLSLTLSAAPADSQALDVYAFLHPDPSGSLAYADMIRSDRTDGDGITVGRSLEPTTSGPVVCPAASGGVTAPGQVTGLTAGTATSSAQPLSWTAPASGGAPSAYTVEYRLTGGSTFTTFANNITGTSTTVTGLTAATGYDYRVTATNAAGSGTPSSVMSATTAAASGAGPAVGDVILVKTYHSGTSTPGTIPGWNLLDQKTYSDVTGTTMALLNSNGGSTGLTGQIINGNITGGNGGGATTGNNSGVFPDAVMASSVYADKGNQVGAGSSSLIDAKIAGFAAGTTWKVESLTNRAVTSRLVNLGATGQAVQAVDAGNNTTKLAVFTGVVPASGVIDVTATQNGSENYAYLNGFRLTRTA
jgi:hypothetical protein